MPEEPKGQNEVVEKKQPEAVPTSKQTQNESGELPGDVSEMTREQFAKLKEANSRLIEENRQLKGGSVPTVLESLKPRQTQEADLSQLNQDEIGDVYSNLVDENGYVDQNLLVSELREAKRARELARQADLRARQTQEKLEALEERAQVKQTHSKYPQLDPRSENFDERFYKAVKNEMISQLMNGQSDFLEAADKVSSWYRSNSNQDEQNKKSEAERKEQQVRKIQATTVGQASGKNAPPIDEDLVRRTQMGDRNALMERLNRIGA